jgi:hypothetical protein
MKKLAIMAGALGLLVTAGLQADSGLSSQGGQAIQHSAGTGTLPASGAGNGANPGGPVRGQSPSGAGRFGGSLPSPDGSVQRVPRGGHHHEVESEDSVEEITEYYSMGTDTAIMQIMYNQLSPQAKQIWVQLPQQWREVAVELAQEDLNHGSFYNIDDPDQYVYEALQQYQGTMIEPEQ